MAGPKSVSFRFSSPEPELEKQKTQIAEAVALALAEWGKVELMMTFTFVSVLDRSRKSYSQGWMAWDQESPARRMFHTIFNAMRGFDVRIDVLSEAINESDLRADLKKIWPPLAARLKKQYKRRHKVAHFIFENVAFDDGPTKPYVSPFPTTVTDLANAKRLDINAVTQMQEQFRTIGATLNWFTECIEIQRRRQKGPRQPTPELISEILRIAKSQNQPEQP